MLVCHCYGVTDRDIRDAVRRGDEATVAGTGCGGCLSMVESLVAAERHAMTNATSRSFRIIGQQDAANAAPSYLPDGAAAGPE